MFDIKKAEQYMLYKVIAGSKSYGLDLPTSDTDIRGIYLQPNEYRLGFGYKEQVNDEKNDIVYYELNRFIHLLVQNNPNIIETLFVPRNMIMVFDAKIKPLYDNRYRFLSKKIKLTFGGYAISQIKKARGLNKKIMNPVGKKRKTILDFCYIIEKDSGYMLGVKQWLKQHNMKQEFVGLSKLPRGEQIYKVFYDWLAETKNRNPRYANIAPHGFRGIAKENSNDVLHSEIPKGIQPEAFLYYDKNGYSTYCRQYKEYWDWVKKRNPYRYNDNVSHGQGYDGKNLMHCLRMLDMAIEIAEGKGVNLIRPNRGWLLSVRRGEIAYSKIMYLIEEKTERLNDAFEKSDLPNEVNIDMAHDIIMQIRNA